MQDERLTDIFNAASEGRESARLTKDESIRAGTNYTSAHIGMFLAITGTLLQTPLVLAAAAFFFYRARHRLPDDGLPKISPDATTITADKIGVQVGHDGARKFLLPDHMAFDIAAGSPDAIRTLVDAVSREVPLPPESDTTTQNRTKLTEAFRDSIREYYDFNPESVRADLKEQSDHSMTRKGMVVLAAVGALAASPTILAVGIAGIACSFMPYINPHQKIHRMFAPNRHGLLELCGRLHKPGTSFRDTARLNDKNRTEYQNELCLSPQSMKKLCSLDAGYMETLLEQCRKEYWRRPTRRTRLMFNLRMGTTEDDD